MVLTDMQSVENAGDGISWAIWGCHHKCVKYSIRHVMHMTMQVLLHLAHVSGLHEKQASAIAACGCSMLPGMLIPCTGPVTLLKPVVRLPRELVSGYWQTWA